jgi:hypothetical protein
MARFRARSSRYVRRMASSIRLRLSGQI